MQYKHERICLDLFLAENKAEIPIGVDTLDWYMSLKPGTWRLISVSSFVALGNNHEIFDFFWSIPDKE